VKKIRWSNIEELEEALISHDRIVEWIESVVSFFVSLFLCFALLPNSTTKITIIKKKIKKSNFLATPTN